MDFQYSFIILSHTVHRFCLISHQEIFFLGGYVQLYCSYLLLTYIKVDFTYCSILLQHYTGHSLFLYFPLKRLKHRMKLGFIFRQQGFHLSLITMYHFFFLFWSMAYSLYELINCINYHSQVKLKTFCPLKVFSLHQNPEVS